MRLLVSFQLGHQQRDTSIIHSFPERFRNFWVPLYFNLSLPSHLSLLALHFQPWHILIHIALCWSYGLHRAALSTKLHFLSTFPSFEIPRRKLSLIQCVVIGIWYRMSQRVLMFMTATYHEDFKGYYLSYMDLVESTLYSKTPSPTKIM